MTASAKERAELKGVATWGRSLHGDFYRRRADRVAAAAAADAAALAARARRSLTAEFCGDPLPGRSALDQRRSGVAP